MYTEGEVAVLASCNIVSFVLLLFLRRLIRLCDQFMARYDTLPVLQTSSLTATLKPGTNLARNESSRSLPSTTTSLPSLE